MEPGGPRPKPRIRLPPTKKPVMLISLILIKIIFLVKDGEDAFGHDQMLIHLIQIKVMRAMKKMMMKKTTSGQQSASAQPK